MLLYYITGRKGLAGTDAQQRRQLLVRIGKAAQAGVDYIQLREKDLAPRDLERLARDAVRMVRDRSATTKLLINGRADVALAAGADGVHLPAGEITASEVHALWMQAGDHEPTIAVSAHTVDEVRVAATQGTNFVVLAPIFEKAHTDVPAIGIDALRDACAGSAATGDFAVLSLGGVTLSNARACLDAGAAGVAGIRLFQNGDVIETVRRLREMEDAPVP
ncbi:MAG: thiamine phosphate synthase [Candidatus Korobacteraceae bacterium]